jgi:hypothetical protein
MADQASLLSQSENLGEQLGEKVGLFDARGIKDELSNLKDRFGHICKDVQSELQDIIDMRDSLLEFNDQCSEGEAWLDTHELGLSIDGVDPLRPKHITRKMAELMVQCVLPFHSRLYLVMV